MSAAQPKDKTESTEPGPELSDGGSPGGAAENVSERPKEIGGRGGLDPTRYGDWEKAGRCIDF